MLIVGSGNDPYLTTQATANLVAVAAIAARVYRPFDPDYADLCLSAARRGWRWIESMPDSHFSMNPKGIETGAYEDNDAKDERLWAASELFRTTGDESYHAYFLESYRGVRPLFNSGFPHEWRNVRALALYGYAIESHRDVDAKVQQEIRQEALKAADEIVARVLRNGYRVPLTTENYIWGSNALVANYGMMLRLANRISPKPEYANTAQDSLHYLFGRNTFNTSYVTQVGSRWPMNPHHRPSEADDVLEPWPGMLIGGPNAQGAKDNRPPALVDVFLWHHDFEETVGLSTVFGFDVLIKVQSTMVDVLDIDIGGLAIGFRPCRSDYRRLVGSIIGYPHLLRPKMHRVDDPGCRARKIYVYISGIRCTGCDEIWHSFRE